MATPPCCSWTWTTPAAAGRAACSGMGQGRWERRRARWVLTAQVSQSSWVGMYVSRMGGGREDWHAIVVIEARLASTEGFFGGQCSVSVSWAFGARGGRNVLLMDSCSIGLGAIQNGRGLTCRSCTLLHSHTLLHACQSCTQVNALNRRAVGLMRQQRELEQQAEQRWRGSATFSGADDWIGNQIECVEIDDWGGPFRFVLIKVGCSGCGWRSGGPCTLTPIR